MDTTTHLIGRHYETRQPVRLTILGRRISEVRLLDDADITAEPLAWIAPGFIDIQSNGYGGQEFSAADLTIEKVAQIVDRQSEFGVTRFCPTVTTAAADVIVHAMRTIAAACKESPEVDRAVAGIHLEGPYIAREDGPRGAHPLAHCRPPDWREFERFQQAAEGRIRLVTLSPEYPEAVDFIGRLVAGDVVPAIGHTSANSVQIRAAVEAGARLSTHLGNGAHRMLRRHPNYIWDQMADDRLMASLIVDGHHLPGEVVQSLVRAKTPQRCILISDLSGLAGLPPGRYSTSLCELEILDDGRLVIAGQDQLLAGASRPIGDGIAGVMRFAGVDLPTAVHMATRRPARLLRLEEAQLRPGGLAEVTLFHLHSDVQGRVGGLEVSATLSGGVLRRFDKASGNRHGSAMPKPGVI